MLNFSVMCPQKWTFGLIQCFLDRAHIISSSWLLFSKEVDFLGDVFWKKAYPKELFNSCLRHFLNLKHVRDNSEAKVQYDKVETVFLISSMGLPPVIFGRKLKRLLKEYYCIDVKVVFSLFKVTNYCSPKCHTPMPLDGQCRISVYMFTWCKFYLYWQNYLTFGHKGKGTYHLTFCDQRTFVIMHNL